MQLQAGEGHGRERRSCRFAEVLSDSVNVKVQDGWITLKRDVTYEFQSDAGCDDVATLHGVCGVTNEIKVNAL
jgi:hypothetical protein